MEIRDTVVDFLNRCRIAYRRDICVDPAFDEDCHTECLRRGYDMKTLAPFLRVGIDIAGTAYTHLKDKKVQRYVAIYTAYLTYLDDFCQTEAGIIYVSSFLKRFINNEPQEHKLLDDLASILKEVNMFWPPITASLILAASLNFISSLFLDHETKDMQVLMLIIIMKRIISKKRNRLNAMQSSILLLLGVFPEYRNHMSFLDFPIRCPRRNIYKPYRTYAITPTM